MNEPLRRSKGQMGETNALSNIKVNVKRKLGKAETQAQCMTHVCIGICQIDFK